MANSHFAANCCHNSPLGGTRGLAFGAVSTTMYTQGASSHVWRLKWCCSMAFWVNVMWHRGHLKGLKPVWIPM